MKKILALLLAALLLLSCLPLAALAAGAATVTAEDVQAKAGQQVAVRFTVTETAFTAYDMIITYDTSVMTLTEIRAGTGYTGMFASNASNGKVGYANNQDQSLEGELFTAVFQVAEDAPDGTYSVSVDVDYICDQEFIDLDVSVVSGSVTIGDVDAETVPPPPEEEMTFVPPEVDDRTEPVPPDASVPADMGDTPDQDIPVDTPAVDGGYAEDISAPADNTALYIGLGVMALALIAIVVILLLKRRTAK